MAEVFGAVGTGIAILDLILKRAKTFSRLRSDVKGASADIERRTKELELRTQLLINLRADLHPSALQGAPDAVSSIDSCVVEIRQLKAVLKVFEAQLAPGQGWRKVLQTKLEYAWKKEDVEDLYKNVCSANEVFSEALSACQLYLSKATAQSVREMRLQDLPSIKDALQGMRTQDLPPISDAIQDIRTQDLPAITTSLDEIRAQELRTIKDSLHETRTQDLPAMSHTTTSAITSNTGQILQLVGADGQHTRDIVIERGQLTSTEIGNLRTSFQQLLAANNGDLEATLLPPMKEHINDIAETSVQEMRAIFSRFTSSITSTSTPSGQSSTSTGSSARRRSTQRHIGTKQTAAVAWERRLLLGLGYVSLRHETRERILLRIRNYITEKDTSVDTETIYTLGFTPNSWIFGNKLTACNWKFSFRTSRRIEHDHPAWSAIANNDIEAIIGYFTTGQLSINDVGRGTGDTLLHKAAIHYRFEMCEWLVNNGIDAHATNDRLETALFDLKVDRSRQYDEVYDPLINLLVEKCQLDPNDTNKDGMTVMEELGRESSDSRFARLLTLSLELATEPEGYRVQTLFDAIAANHEQNWGIQRLKYLIAHYEDLKPRDDSRRGQKWWHTSDFFWVLGKQVLTTASDVDPNWVEAKLCEMISAGFDLHSTEPRYGRQTLLDHFISEFDNPTDGAENLFRWFTLLHRCGAVSIAEYLTKEQGLHPGGELKCRTTHKYLEYPIFIVQFQDAPNDILLTRGHVILKAPTAEFMPGAWQSDPELDFCEKEGLLPSERFITEDDQNFVDQEDILVARYKALESAVHDDHVCDWKLHDGREGKLYLLWQMSTAGIDRGNYDFEPSITFKRDFEHYPLWVQYPEGWVALSVERDPWRSYVWYDQTPPPATPVISPNQSSSPVPKLVPEISTDAVGSPVRRVNVKGRRNSM